VPDQTAEHVSEAIRRKTEGRVACAAAGGRPAIDRRLAELDREWDIERTLEANAATVALSGVVLAITVDRKWIALPAVVAGFLLQHALQGWCPPVPVFRRLGFRTQREIDEERYALKALRGDFAELARSEPTSGTAVAQVLAAVRR
jgi:hypothetical protein